MEKKTLKFKVGDRVKILDESLTYVNIHKGDCGETFIVDVDNDEIGDVCIQWDRNKGKWWAASGSLVLEREESQAIKLTQEQLSAGCRCETNENLVDWLKSIGFDVQLVDKGEVK